MVREFLKAEAGGLRDEELKAGSPFCQGYRGQAPSFAKATGGRSLFAKGGTPGPVQGFVDAITRFTGISG